MYSPFEAKADRKESASNSDDDVDVGSAAGRLEEALCADEDSDSRLYFWVSSA